ncbi:MAG: glycosyltransferase [Bacteroidales bacterium]|nr:glycosyltransferase [Clostridium sp.]MCM1202928.1 glycosyltransferase [Bacteroidales bacterium]
MNVLEVTCICLDVFRGKDMGMKGKFIVYEDFIEGNLTGIQRKIMSQIRVFNEQGLKCERKFLPRGDEKCGIFIGALLGLFPGTNIFPVWQDEEEFAKLDYIYFRRPLAVTAAMQKFLKKIKALNPNIKVVMEIPTYPYDGELQTVSLFPFLCKDRFNRKKLVGLVDALAVIGGENLEKEIWGLPVISFQNGYDIREVEIAEEPKDNECIDLCCIAMFQPWHGYERLLLGMENYYKNGGMREIKCHMIGEGKELNKYKAIAESKYLKERVVFYGRKSGKELADLYNIMDIGVCSLGMYKIKGLGDVVSVLKSREYMAKGLPMIAGCKIDVFQHRDLDFVCEFENDDSLLNMDRVIAFYDSLQQKKGLRKIVRQFALDNVDMAVTMKPVIDYIKG